MKFIISSRNNDIAKQKLRTKRISDCKWKIYDNDYSYLEWEATFLSVNEWKIECDEFIVYMYNKDNIVEVHKAIDVTSGRTYRSDKFLKKYDQIACMLNGLIQNNMFKELNGGK